MLSASELRRGHMISDPQTLALLLQRLHISLRQCRRCCETPPATSAQALIAGVCLIILGKATHEDYSDLHYHSATDVLRSQHRALHEARLPTHRAMPGHHFPKELQSYTTSGHRLAEYLIDAPTSLNTAGICIGRNTGHGMKPNTRHTDLCSWGMHLSQHWE